MIEASGLPSEDEKKKSEEFAARYGKILDEQRINILRKKYGISLISLMTLKNIRKSQGIQSGISRTRNCKKF